MKPIDTSKMKLVCKRTHLLGRPPDEWREAYLARVVEHEKYRVRYFVTVTHSREWDSRTHRESEQPITRYHRRSTRDQKFWCVGGPRNGQRFTAEEAGVSYLCFNRASAYRTRKGQDRAILVYKGALTCE